MRVSTGQTSKYLAGLFEDDLKAKARSQGIASITHEAPILKDFAVEFLKYNEDHQKIAEDTKRYYKHGWKMLSETPLAAMRMDKIRATDCDTTKFGDVGGYAANQALRTLSRMYTVAEEMGLYHSKRPKIPKRTVVGRSIAMSTTDAMLIASKMTEGSDPKDVLLIMRATGMRPQEIYRARWEYVNWQEGNYANPNGKTATARRPVPLLDDAGPILRRRHLEQGSPVQGWIFPSASKAGHIVSIAKAFRIARKAAGKPDKMVLYTARHGRATDLAAVTTLKETMLILGHSDPRTALGYQHPKTSDLQARLNEAKTNGRIN